MLYGAFAALGAGAGRAVLAQGKVRIVQLVSFKIKIHTTQCLLGQK